jgi:N-methylhydantoinase B
VQAAVARFPNLDPGDAVILNDPFQGGTHLPDITLVSPVFAPGSQTLCGYVASRAHHADVGGMSPGSMPAAREIYQEGLILPPMKLAQRGQVDQDLLALILANVRTPHERQGDLAAQLAANRRGEERLAGLIERYGLETSRAAMQALLEYTERMTRALLKELPDGRYAFEDTLDDDGLGGPPAAIRVAIEIRNDQARVDFSGSAPQQKGSVNAVYAITLSAVHYVFRCLLGLDVPNNAGCLAPLQVIAPPGSVVNARRPAPVAGGNVETSQRIVDVLLGALAQAAPQRIPAASQGSMNNLTIGGIDPRSGAPFAYYETMAGGMGARPDADGPSALHSHMTNTLNTPAEALEYAYPLRVLRYELRPGSGGAGRFRGGDGLRRDIQTLAEGQATLLTERRRFPPYGLSGGLPGARGENALIRDGVETPLPGKGTIDLQPGDILSIRTPGGGGFGEP